MDQPYFLVNSFTVTDPDTKKQTGGNGAAVFFLDGKTQLADAALLAISAAFPKLAEAVFVYPCEKGEKADFGMRYFSPQRQCEYRITGHPTIAAACAMVFHNHPCLCPGKDDYVLETQAGCISLHIDQRALRVYMGQIQPVFRDVLPEDEREIRDLFRLKQTDVVSPIKAVNMGLGYFIFQVNTVETLMRLERDLPRLTALNARYGLTGGAQPYVLLDGADYALRTRNLDLRPFDAAGLWAEDSACGQGSASLMAYLMKYRGYDGKPLRMQQGVLTEPCCVEAYGRAHDGKWDVFIGGSAVEIENGNLEIAGQRVTALVKRPVLGCSIS